METNVFTLIAFGVATLIAMWVIFYFIPVGLYFTAAMSGVNVSLIQLVFMRWRKVPPTLIVHALIKATKGGIHVSTDELEAHFLAGGNVDKVVDALIYANARAIHLTFREAATMDLGRKDIVAEINPNK